MRALLRENYELVWNSHGPTQGVEVKLQYTTKELEAMGEGGGGGNARMYVVDADGKMLSQLWGHWSPDFLMTWLKFGLTLDVNNTKKAHKELLGNLKDLEKRTGFAGLKNWINAGTYPAPQPIQRVLENAARRVRFGGC